MTAHRLVGHIAFPAFHSIVHAQLAYRTERLIVKRWHAQGGPQLFVKLPQTLQMRRQRRDLQTVIGQKKLLIPGIPQSREFAIQHDGRQDRHAESPVGVLPKLRAATILLYADDAARASHGEAKRSVVRVEKYGCDAEFRQDP